MKRKVAAFDIGEGLFSEKPVPVELEFSKGTAVFQMRPLTSEIGVKLEAEGIKLQQIETNAEGLKASQRILEEIVRGWEHLLDAAGVEIPYTPENRDKAASSHALVVQLVEIATELASTKREEEEKNLNI